MLRHQLYSVSLLLVLTLIISGCSDRGKIADCRKMNEGLEGIARHFVEMMNGTIKDLTTKQGLLAHLNEVAEGQEQEVKLISAIPVQDPKLRQIKSQMINSNRRVSQLYRDRAQALAQSSLPEKLDRQTLASAMQPIANELQQPVPNSNFETSFTEMSEYCGLK